MGHAEFSFAGFFSPARRKPPKNAPNPPAASACVMSLRTIHRLSLMTKHSGENSNAPCKDWRSNSLGVAAIRGSVSSTRRSTACSRSASVEFSVAVVFDECVDEIGAAARECGGGPFLDCADPFDPLPRPVTSGSGRGFTSVPTAAELICGRAEGLSEPLTCCACLSEKKSRSAIRCPATLLERRLGETPNSGAGATGANIALSAALSDDGSLAGCLEASATSSGASTGDSPYLLAQTLRPIRRELGSPRA